MEECLEYFIMGMYNVIVFCCSYDAIIMAFLDVV